MKTQKDERLTRAEAARRMGKKPVQFDRLRSRHGISKGKDNKYSWAEIQAAVIAGREMNKQQMADQVPDSPDSELTLPQQRLKKQIEKLTVEIEKLKDERAVTLSKLADVDEIANRFTRLLSDIALRLNTWKESTIAKRPKMRKEIDEVARQLQLMIAEAGE